MRHVSTNLSFFRRPFALAFLFLISSCGFFDHQEEAALPFSTALVFLVTSTAAPGNYGVGAKIPIVVKFTTPVLVTGTPQITLETGTTDGVATYVSGSGTPELVFLYTVELGHNSVDLDYASTTALSLNGGTIKGAESVNASLNLDEPGDLRSLAGTAQIVVDTTPPAVTNVTSSTSDGTYRGGQQVAINVTFNEIVTVTGTPRITLETGATDAVVNYLSGSGTTTLTFTYTIATGHYSSDLEYASTSALALNGGTIIDAVGSAAVLTLPNLGASGSLSANKALVIDGAVRVTNVTSSTSNGSYKAGQSIVVTVTFSDTVTVNTGGGTPTLTLATGGGGTAVAYSGGSGTATLEFSYTIGGGQNASDLDYTATSSLALNSGTIKDAVNIDAILTLPAPGAAGSLGLNNALIVDTTAPTVSNVTSSSSDASPYGIGQSLTVQVVFSEVVTVTGVPTLTLATGGGGTAVNYSGGNGTTTLEFSYTIGSGHSSADLDYTATTSLAGTIKDAAGNDATLTLAGVGAAGSLGANKTFVIDGNAPTVTSVTCTQDNDTYGIGQILNVTVTFSEIVNVTNTPQLTLETGSSDATVNYSSGTGSTTLTFNYTIAAGHSAADLDYTSTAALALNGGTIRDTATNAATLTLASPSLANSLGANKNIVVRTPGTSLTITGSEANGKLGHSVAIVGDVDGDGKADYAIGEPYADGSATDSGKVKIRSGADDSVIYTLNGSETNAAFGFSVAPAGDVNRDGRPEIIIGEPLADTNGTDSGNAYVYSGKTGNVLYTINGGTANAQFGYSVSGAGDINHDGKPDLLIGEPYADPNGADSGKIYVYSGANGSVALRSKDGAEAGALFGYSVSGLGDVNRDGRGDYIVGEPLAGAANRGKAYIYSGSNGAELHPAITGAEDEARLGHSVAMLGDVNSDGKDDFIVGEPLADGGGTDRGKAYIYSGADAAALYTIIGVESSAQLGYAVAAAGDVDRNGKPDFIVGQPYADNGGTDRGKAYVYSGSAGTVLYTIAGSENGATLGSSLSGTGDVNRDGKADLIIGAPLSDSGASDGGYAIRLTSGYTTLPSGTRSLLFTVDGTDDGALLGSSVANVGDTNGDGKDDFLIGEPKAGTDAGAAYLYSGASGALLNGAIVGAENNAQLGYSVAGYGDVNGDGKNDFIIGEPYAANGGNAYVRSGATGAILYTVAADIMGLEAGAELGSSVAILGDVNADGKDDFIVSAPAANNGGTDKGIVYVFSGADGTTAIYTIGGSINSNFLGDKVARAGDYDGDGRADFLIATSLNDTGGANAGKVVVYSGATGEVLRTVTGAAAGDRLGFSIASAGDVDGNGEDDFIAGAPLASGGGKAFVYGNASSSAAVHTFPVTSDSNTSLGYAVSGAGDVDGDGKADLIVGDPDHGSGVTKRGKVYIFSGSSGSTLHTVTGTQDEAHLGTSVGGGGDANKDGKADFVIGEPKESATDQGKAYLYVAPSN